MRWTGQSARTAYNTNMGQDAARKPEGNKPLGRPRTRCEGKVGTDQEETGWANADWNQLAEDKN